QPDGQCRDRGQEGGVDTVPDAEVGIAGGRECLAGTADEVVAGGRDDAEYERGGGEDEHRNGEARSGPDIGWWRGRCIDRVAAEETRGEAQAVGRGESRTDDEHDRRDDPGESVAVEHRFEVEFFRDEPEGE